jgi:hypothetical protein
MALSTVADAARQSFSTVLLVTGSSSALFFSRVIAAGSMVACVVPLTFAFGLEGAAVGLFGVSVLTLLMECGATALVVRSRHQSLNGKT